MPAVTSADQVVREDLSDGMRILDVKNTPLMSRIKNGPKPENILYAWPVEKMGKRKAGGVPEGQDVVAFESDSQQRLYNRVERFQRTPAVTVEAERLNKVAGVDSTKAYNKQVRKKTIEEKRDIEFELLSDQESQEPSGPTPSKFKGLGRVINDGTLAFTDTQTMIPTGFRTPTAQIYTGLLADFTEATLNAMMEARYTRVGASSNLTLYCMTALKTVISTTFGRYVPDKAGYAVVIVTSRADIDKKKLVGAGIDVYEGDYGVMDIELDLYMPSTSRGYLLEMDMLQKRELYLAEHEEFENKGGGRRGLIDSILGYEFGDPRAHCKIAPSDEAVNNPDVDS